jgi:hypothetical protein
MKKTTLLHKYIGELIQTHGVDGMMNQIEASIKEHIKIGDLYAIVKGEQKPKFEIEDRTKEILSQFENHINNQIKNNVIVFKLIIGSKTRSEIQMYSISAQKLKMYADSMDNFELLLELLWINRMLLKQPFLLNIEESFHTTVSIVFTRDNLMVLRALVRAVPDIIYSIELTEIALQDVNEDNVKIRKKEFALLCQETALESLKIDEKLNQFDLTQLIEAIQLTTKSSDNRRISLTAGAVIYKMDTSTIQAIINSFEKPIEFEFSFFTIDNATLYLDMCEKFFSEYIKSEKFEKRIKFMEETMKTLGKSGIISVEIEEEEEFILDEETGLYIPHEIPSDERKYKTIANEKMYVDFMKRFHIMINTTLLNCRTHSWILYIRKQEDFDSFVDSLHKYHEKWTEMKTILFRRIFKLMESQRFSDKIIERIYMGMIERNLVKNPNAFQIPTIYKEKLNDYTLEHENITQTQLYGYVHDGSSFGKSSWSHY